MRVVRGNTTLPIVNIAGSDCTAGTSALHALNERSAIDVIATHRHRQKARCADSESQFLAMKKFSWQPASRLIVARQTRFFGRIAAADSGCDFPLARGIASPRRSMHAGVRIRERGTDDAGATSRDGSDAEFGLEQIVHRLRIGLAAG
jgi:hypothetical protein